MELSVKKVPGARWVAGGAATGSVALMGSALVIAYADRHSLRAGLNSWNFTAVLGQVVNLAIPVVGFVLASRRPANRIGWLFLVGGLTAGLNDFSNRYGLHALIAAPGSWPAGRVFAWLTYWIWPIPYAILAFIFLLFPTGRPRSRWWRLVGWFVAGAFALPTADILVIATAYWSDPFQPLNRLSVSKVEDPLLLLVSFILMFAALLVSGTAVVVRFAKSSGEERQQLKWFTVAAAAAIATFVLTTDSGVGGVAADLALLFLWVSIGIAVLKYRLYEIDIVISKAVLYGSLAVFITGVYAGLVAGVGTLVGHRQSTLLSALAAAVVAVAFQPVRQRAGRLANRVVYGRRATPYQVLSEFAQRIGGEYAHRDVMPQMASIVAAGTGAARVVVWLRVDDELRAEASAGSGPDIASLPVDGNAMPPVPDAAMTVPVVHQHQLLGAISIWMPKDEPLRPVGEQLVTDVASQAGLVLSNAGLIEDLRASRQRLVTAQDEVRRRLERDIHDGAQQDLVAMAIKVRLAGITIDEDVPQTKEILGELQADAACALENLRELARGVYPPLLAEMGLITALDMQARKAPVPVAVVVDAGPIGRYSQDTEAAVYFCCLEALQNTAKYAQACQARISLQVQDSTLCFCVSDDGTGYDTARTPMGSGIRNMADRLAALGGRLQVWSAPGQGTTITGHLPVIASDPVRLTVNQHQSSLTGWAVRSL
jgi:signal transduction histidine kinase